MAGQTAITALIVGEVAGMLAKDREDREFIQGVAAGTAAYVGGFLLNDPLGGLLALGEALWYVSGRSPVREAVQLFKDTRDELETSANTTPTNTLRTGI